MDPIAMPLTVFTTDVGGGGGPPAAPAPAASPADAANARIDAAVAAGMTDDTDLAAGAPPAGGPPAAPGTEGQPDADVEPDFDNLTYRDGVKLREQFTKQKDRYKPFADAVGTLPDEQRQAVLEALQSPDVVSFVHAMNPNDRQTLLGIYQTFLSNPTEAAAQFRALADQIAPSDAAPGSPPAPPSGGAPPADASPDPEAPITRADLEQWQRQQAEASQAAEATRQAEAGMLAELKSLGYDPESSEPTERLKADEVIWLAAFRTGGDIRKAHAEAEARRQAVIDGYVKGKTANAATPGTPETGQSPSGSTDPKKVDPMKAMEARLEAEFGPDPAARR